MIWLCRAGHPVKKQYQTSTNDCPHCRRNDKRLQQRRQARLRESGK